MAKTFTISDEAVLRRIRKMLDLKVEYLKHINDIHVELKPGNTKTGTKCWTTSLIPIVDCINCSGCKNNCYDIRNDCIYPSVLDSRAKNSAIHSADPSRYWSEVGDEITNKNAEQLRINVGGDLRYIDFNLIKTLGEDKSDCDMLFFTKNYDECNQYISENIADYPDNYGFPPNIHPIYSRWIGMECNNPYGVPESHVLWEDGRTTAPEFGAYYCGGNCSECHFNKEGCWVLKKNESVIFKAH